ncbi:MAG: ATP-binding protein [Leptolyngbyaceae cyanobacterium bins.349]|nr:ATP-binding protein [Leptolyngbyaceae cyanobacterium bins.349]
MPNLFQRFFRASKAIHIQGNGIGLTIAEYCIDHLHGAIAFEREVGRGTTVALRLNLE